MRPPRLSVLLLAVLGTPSRLDVSLAAEGNINVAQVGSTTFAVVDRYDCGDDVMKTIKTISTVNRAMFDTCEADSGYQLYPYSGVEPDAQIVTKLVNSQSCVGVITSVVLLNMPPCIIDGLPMRASCETVLYYSTVLDNGASAPTSDQFSELLAWRRDSDLAKAAGAPFDGDSNTKVTVLRNYTIILEDPEGTSIEMKDGKHASFVSSSNSDEFFAGKVVAAGFESEERGKDADDTTRPKNVAAELVTTGSSSGSSLALAMSVLATTLAMAATYL